MLAFAFFLIQNPPSNYLKLDPHFVLYKYIAKLNYLGVVVRANAFHYPSSLRRHTLLHVLMLSIIQPITFFTIIHLLLSDRLSLSSSSSSSSPSSSSTSLSSSSSWSASLSPRWDASSHHCILTSQDQQKFSRNIKIHHHNKINRKSGGLDIDLPFKASVHIHNYLLPL